MVKPVEKRRRLRELLQTGDVVVAPGVYDCLTARLVERAGFDAAIVTGAGLAASLLGVPDVGLVTMSESWTQTRNIAGSIGIPLVADCDTGYGNPINVRRTVSEFEMAGVSALFIEDQVAPKKCGHFAGKMVISAEDMVQKIRAAADARTDDGLLLIARTDARATSGLDEAIRRSELYVRAGAEMIFVEAPQTADELADVAKRLAPLGVPLMVNLVEGGRTPLLSVPELAAMGFRFVTFSGSLQKTGMKAMQGLLASLREQGSVSDYFPGAMLSLDERSMVLGLDHFTELEQRYASQ